MSAPVLQVRGLVAGYGSNTVLHGIDLEIQPGELVSMVGLNGAGKSVAMRCVAGLLRPWEGTITMNGIDVTRDSPEKRVGRGMGMVPQGRGIFPGLTVEQNMRLGGYRLSTAEFGRRAEELYARYPRLRERRSQRAGTMSGGEQAMLAVARALVGSPSLLLLDEPTAGLAPIVTRELADLVAELHGEGVTILLVEQSIGVALRLATRVLLMQKGVIVRETSPDDLSDREALLDELGAGQLYGRGGGAEDPSGRTAARPTAPRPRRPRKATTKATTRAKRAPTTKK